MAALWPASPFPQFPINGHSEGMPDNVEKIQMDTGPPQTRRRTTQPTRPVKMTFRLSEADMQTLRTFYRTTLLDGSLPFEHFLPDDQATRFIFLFNSPPNFQNRRADMWDIELDLLIVRLA